MYTAYNQLPADIKIKYDFFMSEMQSFFNFQGVGYCFELSCHLRNVFHVGEVITFSCVSSTLSQPTSKKNGVSLERIRSGKEPDILPILCDFQIPCDNTYRGLVTWVYHTVFVCDNFVFTPELLHPVPLSYYKRLLRSLNSGKYIVGRPEKVVSK